MQPSIKNSQPLEHPLPHRITLVPGEGALPLTPSPPVAPYTKETTLPSLSYLQARAAQEDSETPSPDSIHQHVCDHTGPHPHRPLPAPLSQEDPL